MFAHLHLRSWFSFQAGGSPPQSLVEKAAGLGFERLAITDVGGMYGAVRFQKACSTHGITPIFGAEVPVQHRPLVLLARSRAGYRNLCALLSCYHQHLRQDEPLTISDLRLYQGDLHCLTGAHEGLLYELLDQRRFSKAVRWIDQLYDLFGARLSIEAAHHLRKGDGPRIRTLEELSNHTGVPLLATGDVRYAHASDYKLYDLLTCIRLGQTVFRGARERPVNSEAHLKSEHALRKLIRVDSAFDRAAHVAADCAGIDLLPGAVLPPAPQLEETQCAKKVLKQRCRRALIRMYGAGHRQAQAQLEHELDTIIRLGFEEFFLVVAEVVEEAHRRGIRCAGRGSAANSIVAYLLGITKVDPLKHNLLFERFLHRGRTGTPDIDIDFGSERRDEIIDWMEERFGTDHTAMTATIVTYRLRSAIRDAGKALGFSQEDIGRLAKLLPRREAYQVGDFQERIRATLGDTTLTHTLMRMVIDLAGCPRYLGLHSGGMVLAREPLHHFSPVQRSASGVAQVQFDKHDVEALGLVKLDVLGLRMLSTVSEAEELVRRDIDPHFDVDQLPEDDIPTFNMMRAGETIGCFQIESQGQIHLIAKHQPECFGDLITEIALFRPGPLQGGMVHPFVRRRQGREPVTYEHPSLEPILKDTYGVILFQEQVLEVAHQFAGMSLEEADAFRRLMSSFRDPGAMEDMREQFVEGALRCGRDIQTAHTVFDQISGFVGYGFCRSHAAAFAQTVYQSAYLKRHYPAAFMAALMQHRPGMYDQQTLEEEARRFGVRMLPPCIARSGLRYRLEEVGDNAHAIRKPLTAVRDVSEDNARRILFARLTAPFEHLEDLYRRLPLSWDVLESLARSGALHMLEERRRTALWKLGVLRRRLGPAGQKRPLTLFEQEGASHTVTFTAQDIPSLPLMKTSEQYSWDLELHEATPRHPVTLLRRQLAGLEVRPIETCYRIGRRMKPTSGPVHLRVAGRVMLRQQPPTAKGMMFITLEDETGHIQCVVAPDIQMRHPDVLRQPALIAYGKVEVEGNWRGLMVERVWPLRPLMGGYHGFPSSSGGRGQRRIAAENDPPYLSGPPSRTPGK